METKRMESELKELVARMDDPEDAKFEDMLKTLFPKRKNFDEAIFQAQEVARKKRELDLAKIDSYQDSLILVSQLANILLQEDPKVSRKEYRQCLAYILQTANDTFLDIANLLEVLKK